MTSGFQEFFDSKSETQLVKARANFGRSKEVCFNLYNWRVYCHITSKLKAFESGKFHPERCKTVSLGEDEVYILRRLLGEMDEYSQRLRAEDGQTRKSKLVSIA